MQEVSKELIIRAAGGDMVAFEEIYRRTSSYVYTIAYKIVGSKEEAEEVTQEVFLSVYRKLKSFRFKSTFKTWIYRVTTNRAINSYRRISRSRKRNVVFDEAIDHEGRLSSQDEKFEKDHNEALVSSMMSELPPEQRACLLLKEIEGMKYEEIADTLKIKLNTVRTRIKRAREKLISRFGKGSDIYEMRKSA